MELSVREWFDQWRLTVLDAGLEGADQRVAITMGRYANPDGSSAYPGVVRLAAEAHASTRSVCRALKRMRELGIAVRVSRSDRRIGRADMYKLIISTSRRQSSHDTSGRVPTTKELRKGAQRSKPGPNHATAQIVAKIPGLNDWERRRVVRRAAALVDGGTSFDVVAEALTAPLPPNTRSVAGVLHHRLLGLEGRSESEARAWLANRVRAVTRGARGHRTTPRPVADWGPTSLTVGTW